MAPAQIDHIIILLPHAKLLSLPPWITDNFTITPGGRHLNNATENKLIIFRDGTYIELISFIDDSADNRRGHWWGDKSPGFLDFAFTDPEYDYPSLREAALRAEDLGVDYAPPQAGGRMREDGQEVRWSVTFPKNREDAGKELPKSRRGEVPFFCQDETPRGLRVDTSEANTTHPCGAVGVAMIGVAVPGWSKESEYVKFCQGVLRTGERLEYGRLPLEVPGEVSESGKPWLEVQVRSDSYEQRTGIVELGLRVGAGQGSRPSIMENGMYIRFIE